MSKFQPFRFAFINELLGHLPPHELKLVKRLQRMVLQCVPNVKEKLSYNTPCYFRHARICYILYMVGK